MQTLEDAASSAGTSMTSIPHSPSALQQKSQMTLQATSQAVAAARSILATGGSEATALKTAKAAAVATLTPRSNPEEADSITSKSTNFLRKRKVKRQAEIIASMALAQASAELENGGGEPNHIAFPNDWGENLSVRSGISSANYSRPSSSSRGGSKPPTPGSRKSFGGSPPRSPTGNSVVYPPRSPKHPLQRTSSLRHKKKPQQPPAPHGRIYEEENRQAIARALERASDNGSPRYRSVQRVDSSKHSKVGADEDPIYFHGDESTTSSEHDDDEDESTLGDGDSMIDRQDHSTLGEDDRPRGAHRVHTFTSNDEEDDPSKDGGASIMDPILSRFTKAFHVFHCTPFAEEEAGVDDQRDETEVVRNVRTEANSPKKKETNPIMHSLMDHRGRRIPVSEAGGRDAAPEDDDDGETLMSDDEDDREDTTYTKSRSSLEVSSSSSGLSEDDDDDDDDDEDEEDAIGLSSSEEAEMQVKTMRHKMKKLVKHLPKAAKESEDDDDIVQRGWVKKELNKSGDEPEILTNAVGAGGPGNTPSSKSKKKFGGWFRRKPQAEKKKSKTISTIESDPSI